MKNILVTGGNGQLGSELQVIAPDYEGYRFFFTEVEELDITKRFVVQEFCEKNDIHIIINCAAYTAVDKAEEDFDTAQLINFEGVANLASVSENNSIYLVHVSTDYVFNGKHFRPYTENDITNPNSKYGVSKLNGENAFYKYKHKGLIIRTSWLYSTFGANFVKTMLRLGSERKELNVIFDQVGSPTYAHDLARGIMEILPQAYDKEVKTTYHFSNEGVCSWYDFAKEIMDYSDLNCIVSPIPTEQYPLPAPRPFYSVMSKDKIKKDFNIQIPHWKDSLHDCLNQLK
jgi:dTDP-4-dehydrorhamnose reductase